MQTLKKYQNFYVDDKHHLLHFFISIIGGGGGGVYNSKLDYSQKGSKYPTSIKSTTPSSRCFSRCYRWSSALSPVAASVLRAGASGVCLQFPRVSSGSLLAAVPFQKPGLVKTLSLSNPDISKFGNPEFKYELLSFENRLSEPGPSWLTLVLFVCIFVLLWPLSQMFACRFCIIYLFTHLCCCTRRDLPASGMSCQ